MSKAEFPSLCQFSTAELLDEIERRALGILCVAVRVEEPASVTKPSVSVPRPSGSGAVDVPRIPEDAGEGGDTWYYRVKGSNIMLGALNAAVTIKLQKVLNSRGRSGDVDWAEA